MANYVPRLVFGPEPPLDLTFDTPPEGDPQNETLGTEKEQVRSVGGQLFTSDFYDYRTFTLRFILQSNATALKLKRLFEDYALKGESFLYFPHSDDDSISFPVELESETVTFNRDYPDGQDGFLWSFEFTLINVTRTAPRITRSGTQTVTGDEPGPVRNFAATEIGSESVTLTWDEPEQPVGSNPIINYELRRGEDGPIIGLTTDGGITNITFHLTGLTASTQYTYYIRAVDNDGLKGVPWVSVTFTTTADASPISEVLNLRTTSVGRTSATIEWDAPTNGTGIIGYDVEMTSPMSSSATSTDTEHDFTGLVSGNQYTVRVRAKTATENGPWATLDFSTLSRDFWGNNRSSNRGFSPTSNLGDVVDPYGGFDIDLSDGSQWAGGTNPNYAFATTSTRQIPLRSFALSYTDINEMAILANVRSRSFTFGQRFLILKKSGNNFVPYRFVRSSGILQDIDSLRLRDDDGNFWSAYVYVKYGDSYVYSNENPHVNDERYWFRMTHESEEAHYSNGGCCIVNNVYFYVADYRGDMIRCYDLRTRARVPSRDIRTITEIFPSTIYSNGVHIWLVSTARNKVFCYEIRNKARSHGFEFSITPDRYRGIFATNNHFVLGVNPTVGGPDPGFVGYKI